MGKSRSVKGVESDRVSGTAGVTVVSQGSVVLAPFVSAGSGTGIGASGDCSAGSGSEVGSDICGGMSTTAAGWDWRTGLEVCAS